MSLDSAFDGATKELRANLDGRDVPAFSPKRPVGPTLGVVAAVVALAGGVAWLAQSADRSSQDVSIVAGETPDAGESPVAGESPLIDGGTEAELVQITTAAAGEAIIAVHTGTQVFNADGSLVVLYQTGAQTSGPLVLRTDDWSSVDAASDALRSVSPTDIEDLSWDATDPSLIRFVEAGTNQLMTLDLVTGQKTPAHVFADCDEISSGTKRGSTDAGSGTFGFFCIVGGEAAGLVSVDLSSDVVRSAQRVDLDPQALGIESLASGDGFVLTDGSSITVLNADLTTERVLLDGADVSSMIATTLADGTDVLVATIFSVDSADALGGVGSAVMIDVVTGELTTVVGPDTGYAYPPAGTVLSLPARARPGVFGLASPATGADDGLTGHILVVDVSVGLPTVVDVGRLVLEAPASLEAWSGARIALSPSADMVMVSGTAPAQPGEAQSINSYALDTGARGED